MNRNNDPTICEHGNRFTACSKCEGHPPLDRERPGFTGAKPPSPGGEMSDSEQDDRNEMAMELIEEEKRTGRRKGKPRPPAVTPPPSPGEIKNLRRALLGELAGYFRGAGESELEGVGNAMEKAMMIGIAYGQGGQRQAGAAVGLLGIPDRYAKAIIDTLEGKV